jgi:uncharacterized cupredoxin-like copper-binding protein
MFANYSVFSASVVSVFIGSTGSAVAGSAVSVFTGSTVSAIAATSAVSVTGSGSFIFACLGDFSDKSVDEIEFQR